MNLSRCPFQLPVLAHPKAGMRANPSNNARREGEAKRGKGRHVCPHSRRKQTKRAAPPAKAHARVGNADRVRAGVNANHCPEKHLTLPGYSQPTPNRQREALRQAQGRHLAERKSRGSCGHNSRRGRHGPLERLRPAHPGGPRVESRAAQ